MIDILHNSNRIEEAVRMENSSFVIITGLSGAGKSNAVKVFEDMGYFCVDNLPAPLIPKFAELCLPAFSFLNKGSGCHFRDTILL